MSPMFIYLVGAALGGAIGFVLGRWILGYVRNDLEPRAWMLARRPWPFSSQQFARRWSEVIFLILAPLTTAGIGASLATAIWFGRTE